MSVTLELASFEEIAAELAARFENMAVKHEPGFNALQRYRFTGDPNTLLGLLDTLHYSVLREKERVTEDTDDV